MDTSSKLQVNVEALQQSGIFIRTIRKVTSFKIPIFIPFLISCVWICCLQWHAHSDEVCFGHVGCFPLGMPWSERPQLFHFVPQSPSAIKTTFQLFSKKGTMEIYPWTFQLSDQFLIKDIRLYIIIHGYLDDTSGWALRIKDAIIFKDKDNQSHVILVDWRSGAKMYYPQVVSNTRVVAAEISILLEMIKKQASLASIHVIGHSLGAHVASYVGKRVKGISKITALDAAFPLFSEGYGPELGLNSQDATIVEVFHSNVGPMGFGLRDPVGTIDIYINNGRDQHGCREMNKILNYPITMEIISASRIQDDVSCSHRTAYKVYEKFILSKDGIILERLENKLSDHFPFKTLQRSRRPLVLPEFELGGEQNVYKFDTKTKMLGTFYLYFHQN